jgi:hypothetical protein
MEFFGVLPCPWITVIDDESIHSVHSEHCFHGTCSKNAVEILFS